MSTEHNAESVADIIGRMMTLATKGCCGDNAWRGRFCAYHQGMEAGLDMALTTLDRTLQIDGHESPADVEGHDDIA